MGNWGSGTFENDRCCDIIGRVVEDLITKIDKELKQLKAKSSLEQPALVYVAVLAAIVKNIENTRLFVSDSQVTHWRTVYIDWLESDANREILGDDFNEWKRNANLEFRRVLRYCKGD